jgi:two-component system sensor histidine kinase CpxA
MPPTPRAFLRAGEPPRYWLVAGGFVPEGGPRRPLRLVLSSESISGGGLFLDPIPWLWAGSGVLVFSVLWWLPFVRGITRAVSRMTAATERIAEGRFDAAAPEERSDELGRLGAAINRMATRLDGFVHGQKRFLGDVAHELCTPLARMEMALGVLEQRADAASMDYVRDVREEVRHMSGLVDELLQFSKAGLKPRDLPLVAVPLRALAQRVVGREAPDDPRVRVEVPDGLAALGDPDLLARGLGNLVRNALRHAGGHGPITIAAIPAGDAVRLEVADGGPGVPPDHLARLGEPFFRPDPARTREGGGAGLGLAIVKTCAAACRGRLELRNGADRGLVAALVLGRAPSGEP